LYGQTFDVHLAVIQIQADRVLVFGSVVERELAAYLDDGWFERDAAIVSDCLYYVKLLTSKKRYQAGQGDDEHNGEYRTNNYHRQETFVRIVRLAQVVTLNVLL